MRKRSDLATGGVFASIGIYLIVSALALPPGMGRLPGPGFFPLVVGAVITLLASLLLVSALRRAPETAGESAGAVGPLGNPKQLAMALVLIALHLLLWGVVPFAVRTAVVLTLFLAAMGERWRQAIAVAVVLTAIVTLAFQYGLRVALG